MKFDVAGVTVGAFLVAIGLTAAAAAQNQPVKDQVPLFADAKNDGKTGIARKTKPVDARKARPGEVVVTVIKDEGVETKSKPAEPGDWVVRNRCPETGNEEILVKAEKFPTRYGEAQSGPDAQGYQMFNPKGSDMGYFIVSQDTGEFTFTAPWGEKMVAKPGDAIVQVPNDPSDTYRIDATAFCLYL